jgi:prepilin-type N-terminal cleavage/methylation domain-containing protein
MNGRSRHTKGFTLVEMMVVIAVIAALLSIAAPQFSVYFEQGRKAKCLSNRYHIEQDERTHYMSNNSPSLAIDSRYLCVSGGTYAWLVADPAAPEYPRVGCSLHYGQTLMALTSLGSTFTEITTAMIDLITRYVQQKNRYPRSSGDRAFTDLGLNPAEWAQPVNGLLYTPAGEQVIVEPAPGYTMTIKTTQGTTVTLTPDLNWNLLYDVPTGQWYYRKKEDKNVVDIKTLQVIKKQA